MQCLTGSKFHPCRQEAPTPLPTFGAKHDPLRPPKYRVFPYGSKNFTKPLYYICRNLKQLGKNRFPLF